MKRAADQTIAYEPPPYDRLTLAIEESDMLAQLIAEVLAARADERGDPTLYALVLVARSMSDRHAQMLKYAEAALRETQGGAR